MQPTRAGLSPSNALFLLQLHISVCHRPSISQSCVYASLPMSIPSPLRLRDVCLTTGWWLIFETLCSRCLLSVLHQCKDTDNSAQR